MSVAQVDCNGSSLVGNEAVNGKNIKVVCKRSIDFDSKNGVRKVPRVDITIEQPQDENENGETLPEDWHPTYGTRYINFWCDYKLRTMDPWISLHSE